MRIRLLNWISRFLGIVLALGAILFIAIYIYVALSRIAYPYDLEWMEGGSVDHVARILAGESIYVSPSINFIPYAYTPLYYYVSAAFAFVMGLGLTPLRLVSFLSSLGCLFVILMIVKRETGNLFAGLISMGLFAGTFGLGGGWFDLARVDSLFLFFILISIYVLRFYDSIKAHIFSGILVFLAFMSKQTALLVSLPLMYYSLAVGKKRGVAYISTVVLLTGVSTIILNHLTNGWYVYYILDLVSERPRNFLRVIHFFYRMIPFIIPFAFSFFYFFKEHPNSNYRQFLFYIMMASGMIGASLISRSQEGAFLNALIPAYTAISILFGIGLNSALEFIRSEIVDRRKIMEITIYLFCIAEFMNLMYNPLNHLPSSADMAAGKILLEAISKYKGDVLMPYYSHMPTLVGKRCCAHEMAIYEVLRSHNNNARRALDDNIRQTLRDKGFDAIILSQPESDNNWNDIYKEYYALDRPVFISPIRFRMIEGGQFGRESIYLPQNNINDSLREKY